MIKHDDRFWLHQGSAIKDLKELSKALETMPEEVFKHHVNSEKNDFHNWVRDVHKAQHIADKIAKVKTKEEMKRYLDEFLYPKIEHKHKITNVKAAVKRHIATKHNVRKIKKKEDATEPKANIALEAPSFKENDKIKETNIATTQETIKPKLSFNRTFALLDFLLGLIIGFTVAIIYLT